MKANCVVCGRDFEKLGAAKTCGPKCRKVRINAYGRIRMAKQREAARPPGPFCAACGNKFKKVTNSKTCGESCKKIRKQLILRAANSKPERKAILKAYQNTQEGRLKKREAGKRYESSSKYYSRRRGRDRSARAAKLFGLSPELYTAMKIAERFAQTQETSPDVQDPRQQL